MNLSDAYERWTSEFKWIHGVTPMSNFLHLVLAEVAYFTVIFGLRAIVSPAGPQVADATSTSSKKTKTFSDRLLQLALCTHNALLCVLSAAMFCGAGYEAFKRSRTDGIRWMFCEEVEKKAEGGIYFWTYIYYLSKFQEFIDTFFKVIKGKPLDFLHVYHHAVVALMCWNWLQFSQSLQTIALMFNTFVHIVMYYYYALTAVAPPPWWKKYITALQIIQFQGSFLLSVPFWYIQTVEGWMEGREACAGSSAMVFNACFNLSLLLLFINFSNRTYKSASKKDE